jgi:hypothetical protein
VAATQGVGPSVAPGGNPFAGKTEAPLDKAYKNLAPFSSDLWDEISSQNKHPQQGFYYDPETGRSIKVASYSIGSSDPTQPGARFAIDLESNRVVDQDAIKAMGWKWAVTPPKKYLPPEQQAAYYDTFKETLNNIGPRAGVTGLQKQREEKEANIFRDAKMSAMTNALKWGDPVLANKIVGDATEHWRASQLSRDTADNRNVQASMTGEARKMQALNAITTGLGSFQDRLLKVPSVAAYISARSNAGPAITLGTPESNVKTWNNLDDTRMLTAFANISHPGAGVTNEKYNAVQDGIGILQKAGMLPSKWTGQGMLPEKARLYLQHQLAEQVNLLGNHLNGVIQGAYNAYAMNPLYRELNMMPTIKNNMEMLIPDHQVELSEWTKENPNPQPREFTHAFSSKHYNQNIPDDWKASHPGWNDPKNPTISNDQDPQFKGKTNYEIAHTIHWGMTPKQAADEKGVPFIPSNTQTTVTPSQSNTPPVSAAAPKNVVTTPSRWQRIKQGEANPTQAPAVPTVNSQAEFDALPKGAIYIEDGHRLQKR